MQAVRQLAALVAMALVSVSQGAVIEGPAPGSSQGRQQSHRERRVVRRLGRHVHGRHLRGKPQALR